MPSKDKIINDNKSKNEDVPSETEQVLTSDDEDENKTSCEDKVSEELSFEEDPTKDRLDSCFCLDEISSSHSSFYRNIINFFPIPVDPGIDDAFNYVESRKEYTDTGIVQYKELCKLLEIVPISRVIKSLPTEELNLKYYCLTLKQMRALNAALKANCYVKTVILEDNWMSPKAFALIGDIFMENYTIQSLNLRECRIGEEGLEGLVEGLTVAHSLLQLDLSCNSIGDNGLAALKTPLIENKSIKKLNLSKNNLTENSGPILEAILLENGSIEELDLSWNSFSTGPGNKKLCNGLKNNEKIKHLNLSWNGLGTRPSMLPFRKYLAETEVLEYLDLSNNRIAQASLRLLRTSLSKNKSLITLNLGSNIITPEEAYTLANVLITNPSLACLNLENTCVNKNFLQLVNRIKQAGKTVIFGDILKNYEILGPDQKLLLFKRLKFLAMKPKKKIQKKDFGHFILNLPETSVPQDDFKALIKKNKVKKLDQDLLKTLMESFQTKKGNKVNCKEMTASFMSYYPDTVLPPVKPKQKKGKKGKQGKKLDKAREQTNVESEHQKTELETIKEEQTAKTSQEQSPSMAAIKSQQKQQKENSRN